VFFLIIVVGVTNATAALDYATRSAHWAITDWSIRRKSMARSGIQDFGRIRRHRARLL